MDAMSVLAMARWTLAEHVDDSAGDFHL